ncbi:hypothetical protein [Bacillus alkalisoli]|uniref:hypothetical protein n=1 Tax=Bacillus alkalisoli TaxID=2011008 RepID=UPI000C24289F|nr:hypothetical protein [Bacillus alkalisoli]
MYMKTCQRCKKIAYGSCEFISWSCPSCSEDLTGGKAFVATSFKEQDVDMRKKRMKIYLTRCTIDKVV